jgi:hypothetical protein
LSHSSANPATNAYTHTHTPIHACRHARWVLVPWLLVPWVLVPWALVPWVLVPWVLVPWVLVPDAHSHPVAQTLASMHLLRDTYIHMCMHFGTRTSARFCLTSD